MTDKGVVNFSSWKFRRIELSPDNTTTYSFTDSYKSLNFQELGSDDFSEEPVKLENGKYAMHSGIAPYSGNRTDTIIDFIVISDSQEECKTLFENEKRLSEVRRAELQKQLTPEILTIISQFPGIKCILGRGTVFETNRFVSPGDDIDLTLFFDIVELPAEPELIKKHLEDLTEKLSTINPHLGFTFGVYNTHEDKNISGSDKLLKNGMPVISFDFIPTIDDIDKLQRIFNAQDEYVKQSMKNGKILFSQKSYAMTELLNMINLQN